MKYLWLYGAVLVALWWLYLRRQRRVQRGHAQQLRQSLEAGLAEPASLHPVIDPQRCLGSSSCVKACPEEALGIVDGKAVLVNGAACIGHGACRAACPVDAIELVFGTERRGVDIPQLNPSFESNVPGVFIAGELGGMGLIRKAAEQGRQAIEAIRARARGGFDHDVVIVGCGPAGLSAGLAAIQHKLKYRLIEQEESLGGAVFHYPRNKIAMTAPVKLALIGKVRFGEVQKEKLLEFWSRVVGKTGLKISFRECMEAVEPDGDGFIVRTNQGSHRTRSVLLTMGRRGTPRKLGVPGEESPKVVYRLIDPAQYDGQAVLVVGGGDSALEAALAVAGQPGTTVTLSYRSEAFSRVKQKNRQALEDAQEAKRIRVELESNVVAIARDSVQLKTKAGTVDMPNQA
ncbi:MAG TPA: NAD(P)-binding domain-containing protein, partial [Burkholderiaceae bacterium]|nr:NAD(P)-binding domain-containing protein [Burkholderiaceae bacterium]